MMNGKSGNYLILVENEHLTTYNLDQKDVWEVGRPSKGNIPDIKMNLATISRRHGRFQNIDGIWFYVDYDGKNGTVYNHKHIGMGFRGRIKPVMLHEGDVFVFGGAKKEVINNKTIWGLYMEKKIEDNWRMINTHDNESVKFLINNSEIVFSSEDKGRVEKSEEGMIIYLGDTSFVNGNVEVAG